MGGAGERCRRHDGLAVVGGAGGVEVGERWWWRRLVVFMVE